jgi:hypothetical protein
VSIGITFRTERGLVVGSHRVSFWKYRFCSLLADRPNGLNYNALLTFLLLWLNFGTSGLLLQAQTSSPPIVVLETPVPPVTVPLPYGNYSSKRLLVHTDLPRDEAIALVKRLEATLDVAATYWVRPSRQVIECYVVHNLAKWPDSALPHPLARILVGGVGGGTIGMPMQIGKRTTLKAEVYASTQPGIAEHEAVHAYCTQAFGAVGPDWYKEGMAELAYYGRKRQQGVGCPQVVIDTLRQGRLRSLNDIVNRGRFTGALATSVDDLLSRNKRTEEAGTQVSLAHWTAVHADAVKEARHAYHWSWALCHLLCHNPNYAPRFRALGRAYLTNHPSTFEQHFGAVAREISFEYRFFVQHMDVGYRVDLCAWDWKTRFREMDLRGTFSARVHADRGYQASGLQLSKGQRYRFRGTGQWTTVPNRPACLASGDADGRGKLVGVVMHEHELGEPFDLGAEGQFTAAGDGKLYLRCDDAWNELADNEGAITVRFERAVD